MKQTITTTTTTTACGDTVPRQRTPAIAAALAALGLAVGGCSGLLPAPSPQPAFFALQRPPAAETSHPPAPTATLAAAGAVLVVQVPAAASGFDSAHIVYTQQPHRLQAFARHEWVDAPARMLAPLIVSALEAGGGFSAVVLAPSAAAGQWQLDTRLLQLQQEFGPRPSRVRLVLRAQLVHTASRSVVATRDFESVAPSASEDAPGGVAAAQLAVHTVLAELASWCKNAAASPR